MLRDQFLDFFWEQPNSATGQLGNTPPRGVAELPSWNFGGRHENFRRGQRIGVLDFCGRNLTPRPLSINGEGGAVGC